MDNALEIFKFKFGTVFMKIMGIKGLQKNWGLQYLYLCVFFLVVFVPLVFCWFVQFVTLLLWQC
jgi:hypothetical protein